MGHNAPALAYVFDTCPSIRPSDIPLNFELGGRGQKKISLVLIKKVKLRFFSLFMAVFDRLCY